MRLIKSLDGWDEAAGPDEAAELIQFMRDMPNCLKTELGRAAHQRALKKIKGTWWEKALFPVPIDLKHERTLKQFREDEQRQLDAIREREQALFEKDAEKSATFIERAKQARKEGKLTPASDILKSIGLLPDADADADRGGGKEGA